MTTIQFTLRIVGEDDEAAPVVLTEGARVVLGREATCDLVLRGRGVSRRHAELEVREGRLKVTDLGSSTGTRIDGRLVSTCTLKAGDCLDIGEAKVEVVGAPRATAQGDAGPLLSLLTRLLTEEAIAPEVLLEQVLRGLLTAFHAERAIIFEPDTEGAQAKRLQVIAGGGEDIADDPVSRGLLKSVAESDAPRLLTTLETEELRDSDFPSIPAQLCSILAAPLHGPQGAGVLYLDSALERRRFDEEDSDRLLAFAKAAGAALRRASEQAALRLDRDRYAELHRRRLEEDAPLGESKPWLAVVEEVQRAAPTSVSVFLYGESGTGKELLAREVHRLSGREGAFVAVHCAALPEGLVEAELFGQVEGAFSGATLARPGRIELAQGGTLFLDEVGDIPPAIQSKLLRVLETRRIRRVGGEVEIPVDFRLVGATHVDLDAAVEDGTFRQDLLYRLRVLQIEPPPLRNRGPDIDLLAGTFLQQFARKTSRDLEGFSQEALKVLRDHTWPGNVRELRNAIEQAVVRASAPQVEVADLAPALGMSRRHAGGSGEMARYPQPLSNAKRVFERSYLEFHLQVAGGVVSRAAARVGISRRAFYRKCQDHEIDPDTYRVATSPPAG